MDVRQGFDTGRTPRPPEEDAQSHFEKWLLGLVLLELLRDWRVTQAGDISHYFPNQGHEALRTSMPATSREKKPTVRPRQLWRGEVMGQAPTERMISDVGLNGRCEARTDIPTS